MLEQEGGQMGPEGLDRVENKQGGKLDLYLNDVDFFNVSVELDQDGNVVGIMEDLNTTIGRLGNDCIDILLKKDIPISYEYWEGDEGSGDENPGFISFKKEDFNNLIKDGKVTVTKEGKIELL